jgi:predicted nuclease of predicted toxin-antitoxin system
LGLCVENKLTIIIKDSDFSHRIILHNPPPRIIHIRFGNVKMKEFLSILSLLWNEIQEMSDKSKLVNVFEDRIEAIK